MIDGGLSRQHNEMCRLIVYYSVRCVDEKQGTTCTNFICIVLSVAPLGFIPPSQWKNSIYGTTDALFFYPLYFPPLHTQEKRNVLLSLFY